MATSDWTVDPAAGDFTGSVVVHGDNVYLQPASGTSPTAGLLVSADAGQHFTKYSDLGYGLGCSVSPVTNQVIWAFCSTGMSGGGLISTDGGKTFTGVNLGYHLSNNSSLQGASVDVAVGAGTLSNDPLEQTTNGGNTFTAVEAPLGHTGHWDVIGFTNPQDGHAFWAEPDAEPPDGFQSLWHTTDGGSHWTEVTIKA